MNYLHLKARNVETSVTLTHMWCQLNYNKNKSFFTFWSVVNMKHGGN